MVKLKKKIFSFLLLSLIFLTSCQVKQNSLTPATKATYSAASYSFTDEDYKYAYEVIDEIKAVVEKAEDGNRLIELNDWINSESTKLGYYRQIESVNYYMTGNKDYSDALNLIKGSCCSYYFSAAVGIKHGRWFIHNDALGMHRNDAGN